MHEFPSKPGDILYIATKAGGVGLNITRASRVIVADISWNPVDDNQAVARCWRMGQQKPVFVYRLVADGTLEEGIYFDCVRKHKVAMSLRWGDHEGGQHKEAESYTHQDLHSLMHQGQDVNLSPAACGDSVIVDVVMQLAASSPTIIDHDAQFEQTAQVTEQSCDTLSGAIDQAEQDRKDALGLAAQLIAALQKQGKPAATEDDEEADEADADSDDEAAEDMEMAISDNVYNKLSHFSARRM
eukprot:1754498-Prymnesium_polylepis.1